ncbi:MAG: extracellular solute-binding protein [Clostridia bacterium]|nr:extracellular solute-binding protein [Clostridia bacterium]
MKIKLLSAFLAALMLLACFAGCADVEDDPSEVESGSTEVEADEYQVALDAIEIDLGGEDFAVVCRNDAGNAQNEMMREDTSSDPLEQAVYTRNLLLEEKCGINYIVSPVGTADVIETIANDIKGGSGEYSLAMPNMEGAGTMATRGHARDFHDLPYIDLEADWWDQGTAEMNIGGKLFWMNSDVNFLAHDVTFLILFSKVLAEKEGIDNLYETVENQEWTLDVFSSYVEKVSQDANGDGKYDSSDIYGLIGTSAMGSTMFYASGLKYVQCSEEDDPYLCMTDSDLLKATDLLDKVLEIFYAGNTTYIVKAGDENVAKGMFAANQGLFYSEVASYIVNLKDMSDDFGVLPVPKYDESQENYQTWVHGISSTMVVPVGPQNPEDISKVLECMAILSGKHVIPTYYDLVLKRKTVRDEESAGMLDIIFSNRTYDLVNYYSTLSLAGTFQSAVTRGNNSFASTYSKAAGRTEKALKKLIAQFDD